MNRVIMINSMSFLPYQGRYLRIYNEAKTLVDAGYEVTLIAWDRDCRCPPYESIDGIQVERIPLRSEMVKGPVNIHRHLLFNLKSMYRVLRRPCDIIHCFNLDTAFAGLVAAKLRGKKVTLDLCEPEYYTWWPESQMFLVRVIGYLEKRLSRWFDAVFVHNLYQVRKFRSYGVSKVVQIASVPGTSMIIDDLDSRPKRTGEKVVLGRIGTIYPDAGVEETIAGFKLLVAKGVPVKLFFAGKVLDKYEATFHKLIEPVREHVEVTGAFDISEMPNLYRKIDLSIQIYKKNPTFLHITPTKFFESLANGVPVIASDIGDYRELMAAYPCGVVVDERDPKSMCEMVEKLLNTPEDIHKMAEAGLKLVKNEYSWPTMGKRLIDTYRRLSSDESR